MNIEMKDLKFDEHGLIPTIIQDSQTHEVLMLAYMNKESLRRTLDCKQTWFWSRSRSELWHKGNTSGNTQRVVDIRVDCDCDSLVLLVEPNGPACHTEAWSCFHRRIGNHEIEQSAKDSPEFGLVLQKLHQIIRSRMSQKPKGSYTTYLFEEGLDKILKKIGEETAELIIASKNGDPAAICFETSDLLYHLLVLLVQQEIALDQVSNVLHERQTSRGKELS